MEVPEYLIKAIIRHYGTLVEYYESSVRNRKLLVNAYNAKRLAKKKLISLRNILKKNINYD